MNKLYRILDANINRISEGFRVLEDLARFYHNDRFASEKLKKVRHDVRTDVMEYLPSFIDARDSQNDVGLTVSRELKLDDKTTLRELAAANFKRAQEGLRVVEETLKLLDKYELSKRYEGYRYQAYAMEKEYFGHDLALSKLEKLDTDLYCITAEEHSRGRSNIEVVEEMIAAGIKIIQYREKGKTRLQKYSDCSKIREMTEMAGVTFIINDDIDIALSVGADGIHLGQDDLPVEKAREIAGEEMIIGLSTHSPTQALDAVKRGADYIGVGPIFKTFTKKDVCDPVGLEYLEFVVQNIEIPFVAIGGIKQHNIHEVSSKGARCIALVTEIVGAENIVQKIDAIRKRIRGEI